MPRLIDIAGERFGRLVAVERAPNRGRNTMWSFRCDCGSRVITYVAAVKRGLTKSCGCLHREELGNRRRKHGASGSPAFRSWVSAKGRCTNPKNRAYADYGGRGISMDPRWLNSFEAFLRDMGERPAGMSLDRIDNDGPYSPTNCRWATRIEQARNKRTSVFVDHASQRLPLKEFARLMGVGYTRLHGRMKEFGETAHEAASAMLRRRANPTGPA